jgi:hypothetical protein
MYRKAHSGGGYDAAGRIDPQYDGADREGADGPSYVETVLFGRRRLSAGSTASQPFKTPPQPDLTAKAQLVRQASRKGTKPCAS